VHIHTGEGLASEPLQATALYLSPEVLSKLMHRTDTCITLRAFGMWCCGCLLVVMCTGQHPFCIGSAEEDHFRQLEPVKKVGFVMQKHQAWVRVKVHATLNLLVLFCPLYMWRQNFVMIC